MNLEIARTNMVKQQLRTNDVVDEALLQLIQEIPREQFVPMAYQASVFADMQIPIGHGQVMFTPLEEARLLQALALKPTDTVLEIGTGTGYLTALLARMTKKVYSIDCFADFTAAAQERLADLKIDNVECITARAARGDTDHAPYDVIVMTGSLPALPEMMSAQLQPTGRLFAVIGKPPVMRAMLYQAIHEMVELKAEYLYTTRIPELLHTPRTGQFVL